MRLSIREWFFLSFFTGILLCIFLTSQLSKGGAKQIYEQQKQQYIQALIEINVTGAVISPGVYKFPPGTSVKDILGQAGLSSKADKKKINFRRKVLVSELIDVPEKQVIKKKKLGSDKEENV
jgi:DNA uptake protein ComE-like DNA-binding protein